jgi:hypothetical protein
MQLFPHEISSHPESLSSTLKALQLIESGPLVLLGIISYMIMILTIDNQLNMGFIHLYKTSSQQCLHQDLNDMNYRLAKLIHQKIITIANVTLI